MIRCLQLHVAAEIGFEMRSSENEPKQPKAAHRRNERKCRSGKNDPNPSNCQGWGLRGARLVGWLVGWLYFAGMGENFSMKVRGVAILYSLYPLALLA